ncbi:MAG: FtsX-like permease family protein [Pseudomonadota bacterium]
MSAGAPPVAPILQALFSHWRRHPVQLIALVVGLAVATALWSGVQALNAEARASYDAAAEQVGGGVARLVPTDGRTLDQADWVALRRAGWPVSPLVEGDVTLSGETLRLTGLEPLSLPQMTGLDLGGGPGSDQTTGGDGDGGGFAAFVLPPFQTLAAPETLRRLSLRAGDRPVLQDGARLPPLVSAPGIGAGVLVVDVGVAQRALGLEDRLTALALSPDGRPREALATVTGPRLKRVEPERPGDLDRLTRSFHMNLTAFGLLSFTVGLFIVHAAIGLAFEQRRGMFRTLRATGVSARRLSLALMAEILVLATASGALGLVGGYLVAAALLPDVAASLGGLYGAEVPGALALRPSWFLAGLAMAILGALVAAGQSLWRAATMPVLASAMPEAWAASQRRWLRRQGLLAAGVVALGLMLHAFGGALFGGLVAGFGMLAAMVIAAALMLPVVLSVALFFAETQARPGLMRWFWADGRQQLSGLSLALMALLLALAVNVGVGTMVGSFRLTFTTWLEDRLAADAYFRASDARQADAILAALESDPGVARVLPNWRTETRVEGWPTEVYGFADDPLYRGRWPLLDTVDAPWDLIAAGEGLLVSEQMAYRLDLAPGQRLTVPGALGDWTGTIAGIYADYGNPKGQIRVDVDRLSALFPDVERLAFGLLTVEGERARVVDMLATRFGLGPDQLRDQAGIRALSLSIFDRTFVVTAALNTLTLGVAGIALLTSLVTLSGLRLPQLAPVWAVGLTRRSLGIMELWRMMALALATAVLALPLGLGIAWLLVAVINVEAFGWRLPLHLFPADWARLAALAVLVAALATLQPMARLMRMAPARLIAVFAAAR